MTFIKCGVDAKIPHQFPPSFKNYNCVIATGFPAVRAG